MRKRKSFFKKLALPMSFSLAIASIPVMSENIAQAETDYGLQNPVIETVEEHTWETVYFGNYWQNDTNGDGVADKNDEKEPIRWRVLSKDEEEVFLLADQALDYQRYNREYTDVTWETCTLRSWLNEEFMEDAFSEEEQNAIRTTDVLNEDNPEYGTEGGNSTKDKVYLLSIGEVMNPTYGFAGDDRVTETREVKNTKYAENRGASTDRWWLRSPGYESDKQAFVDYLGDVNHSFPGYSAKHAVRPVLRLNLTFFNSCKNGGMVTAYKDVSTTWDCVFFGNYWKDDTNGDGKADKQDAKQPIKWRVLSVNGDDAFVLADKSLDCQPFNNEEGSARWETSTLRSWLNEEFFENAFSEEEQSIIQTTDVLDDDNPFHPEGTERITTEDKVYLLSIVEVMNPSYGFTKHNYESKTREAKDTRFSRDSGAYIDEEGNGQWWLRTKGFGYTTYVFLNGAIGSYGYYANSVDYAVRPVLHINLSSSLWRPAGKINSLDEDEDPIGTPSPTATPTQKSDITPIIVPTPAVQTGITPTPTPQKVTTPAKVTGLKVKNNKKGTAKVSWKKVMTVSGYQLQYDTTKKFKNPKKRRAKKKSVTIKKLKKKTTYFFRVRAYRIVDGKKVYGKWSSVKKAKIKK